MIRVWRAASVFLMIPGILLAPASRFLSAATPWESIPYNQWTEADARKLLQDSPWVKTVSIQVENDDIWLPLMQYGMETLSTSEADCACGGSDALGASIRNFLARDERFPDYSGTKVKVLLLSSLRIRQALARLSQMRGDVPTMSEDTSLEQRPDDFIIAITGPDLSLFLGASLESLKDSTRLKSKKNSRKTLELSNVGLPSESLKQFLSPAQNGDNMTIFIFPRDSEGKPTFDRADKQIEFETGVGHQRITATFDIDKILVNGVLDF